MDQHRKTYASKTVGDLPADFWEVECKAANKLISSLKLTKTEGKTTADDTSFTDKKHDNEKTVRIDYSDTYIKFQNTRRFPTGVNKSDKKKISRFTKLINDKVRKKSAEILLERMSDDKNQRTTVKDEVNEKISSMPATTKKGYTTQPLNMHPRKIKSKGNRHVKIPIITSKKKENVTKTNNSYKTSSVNDIKKIQKKIQIEKAENVKEIPKICSKKTKIQENRNEIDCRSADNFAQTKIMKSKRKEKVTENGSDIYFAKNVSSLTNSKRNKISKIYSDISVKHSSTIPARERHPDAPKCDTS
ncbi:uncharacterized protein LOC123525005, partial [Mercenaria mercenaria]|uniref:uncharacterized protein LOC123525005 n=1 Tax=Mercenaria mercenaria TaxID=6596 RepID=UPI00234F9A9F